MKIIDSILIENIGYKYAFQQIDGDGSTNHPTGTYRIEEKPITATVCENGEVWYSQGNQEWNGRYVIEVNYKEVR
jgi:hypothetical protein